MTIRQYRPGDLDAVMGLWLAGNLDAHPFISNAYWERNLPAVREQIPQAEVLAAEENGRLLGFLGLSGSYIAGIFVSRPARSQGVGRALLEEAKRRRARLTLRVYRRNSRALAFYLREGFAAEHMRTDPETGEEELCLSWARQAPPQS